MSLIITACLPSNIDLFKNVTIIFKRAILIFEVAFEIKNISQQDYGLIRHLFQNNIFLLE